jgi:CheY-like chemotaxis protein
MKILLVDDHVDSSRVISRMLQREGHSVEAALNCREALDAFEAEWFDLIILDIWLPDGDGCDLLVELRQIHPVKSIAITGNTIHGNIERVMRSGFDWFLPKPISADELSAAVSELFPDLEYVGMN